MTPEQITLVQSSFQRLGPQLPAMATRFYQELFARDPALRPLFTTPMAEQEVRFAEKLTEIVRAMPRLGELLTHTRALGARHAGYGVRAPSARVWVSSSPSRGMVCTISVSFWANLTRCSPISVVNKGRSDGSRWKSSW